MEDDIEYLHFLHTNDFADFKYLDFSNQTHVRVKVRGEGRIRLTTGQPFHAAIATFDISNDEWEDTRLELIAPQNGVKSVHLILEVGKVDVAQLQFV
jgi:hypothetical protein